MPVRKVAVILAAMMFAASLGAIVARPSKKAADEMSKFSLETAIPGTFGDWRNEPQRVNQVVNPQTQELLDKIYSQILTRTYVNSEGYRIMLSIAYGDDQRDSLQAHKPEVCYPAQGFKLHSSEPSVLATPIGTIPAQRLMTSLGPRHEPVTYWFTMGTTSVQSQFEKRLVFLAYGLTGRIPDGVLFRISSIDADQARANKYHNQFINQLVQAIPAPDRARLTGLGSGQP